MSEGKSYNKSQESVKELNWKKTVDLVLKHNTYGNHSFSITMNRFADQSPDDWRSPRTRIGSATFRRASAFPYLNTRIDLPDAVDWRYWGYVTPVKDQGDCAASWAYSATGALEGQYFRKTRVLVSLSEQQLIDCFFGTCSVGFFQQAWLDLRTDGVVDTASYSVLAEAGLGSLATVGPVAAYVDASQPTFQLYNGGIYDEPKCSSRLVDHAVLIVGYGTENGKDYWLVKNSFGVGWGEAGYIRMSRNKNNQCGIATYTGYPLV
ncbi:procathepsin L-like [Neosynchiropus ocellatus]